MECQKVGSAVKLLVVDAEGMEDFALGLNSSGPCIAIHRQFLKTLKTCNGWHGVLNGAVRGFKLGQCGLSFKALKDMDWDCP